MSENDHNRDRRQRRSDDAWTAVRYQLEHVADVLNMDAICVADGTGDVIASAGEGYLAAMLAHAFEAIESDDEAQARLRESVRDHFGADRDVSVVFEEVPRDATRQLWVAAVSHSPVGGVGVRHAIEGITRILDRTEWDAT